MGINELLEPAFLPDLTAWWNLDHVAAPDPSTTSRRRRRRFVQRRLLWADALNQSSAAGPGGPEDCERDQDCWFTLGRGRGNFSLLVRDCGEVGSDSPDCQADHRFLLQSWLAAQ